MKFFNSNIQCIKSPSATFQFLISNIITVCNGLLRSKYFALRDLMYHFITYLSIYIIVLSRLPGRESISRFYIVLDFTTPHVLADNAPNIYECWSISLLILSIFSSITSSKKSNGGDCAIIINDLSIMFYFLHNVFLK